MQKIFAQEVRLRRDGGTSYPEWKNATFSEIFSALKNNTFSRNMLSEDETIGKAIEIYRVGANEVVSGLHTMACRPNSKFAPKYLGYYINLPSYHNQLIPFMQGIKVTFIGRKNIANAVIYYPTSLEEQRKIADFLFACDEAMQSRNLINGQSSKRDCCSRCLRDRDDKLWLIKTKNLNVLKRY